MALRLKKDIKKASYYVWFLGAQESRGLRGEEFALPAIAILEERARDLEPFKVTLQVCIGIDNRNQQYLDPNLNKQVKKLCRVC